MSEAWTRRMKLRTDKLQDSVKEVKGLLHTLRTRGQVVEGTAKQLNTKIKCALDSFSKEFDLYTDKANPTQENIDECMALQIQAEELHAELCDILAESSNQVENSNNTKLPQLDLPTYDGDVLKFKEFWDRFEGSVHTKKLTNADKMSYLKGCLSGEALQSIEGLCQNNENYQIAIDTLKNRFGRQERIVDAHHRALSKLPRAGESAKDCRNTLATIEVHLRILRSLGQDVNNSLLRVMVLDKFPERVLYQVGLLAPNDQTMDSIRKALEVTISAMERATIMVDTSRQMEEPVASSSAAALSCATGTNTTNNTSNGGRKRKFWNRNKGINQNKEQNTNEQKQSQNKEPPKKKPRLCCVFCSSDQHYNDMCDVVSKLKDRVSKVKDRCQLCFGKNHETKACRSKKKCAYCKSLHNRALCTVKFDATGMDVNMDEQSSKSTSVIVLPVNIKTYLQTATVRLHHRTNSQPCRALLDCGSQRSYLTTRLATKLHLDKTCEDRLMVYTFGTNKPKEMSSQYANITIVTKRGIQKTIRVNIVPHITDRIPSAPAAIIKKPIDILADDNSLGEKVDLLIGNDFYFSFMRENRIKIGENFFLIDTDFGWIPSGVTPDLNKGRDYPFSIVTFCQCQEPILPYLTLPDPPLQDVKFLWDLENIGITDSPKTTREEEAVTHFNNTVRYEDHRYQVTWPWIEYPPDLQTNFGLAYGRLKGLIKRLDTKLLNEYNLIINEQLHAGVIEVMESETAPKDQVSPPIHYLPHHIIQQEGKRGRIVYDGSAKLKEERSLNECLYKGPSMLEDLVCLILKFRTNKVGLLADVEKAFLQLGLQPADRDATRFLWLKDPSKGISHDNLLHLRFCRVPFGVVSSPFLLTATIRYHLQNKSDEVVKGLADKIYVDNLVTGTQSTSEAIELYHKTRAVFQELSMNIREWTSNCPDFLCNIPKETRADENLQVKLLGLRWNPNKDTLKLKLDSQVFNKDDTCKIVTKRNVLKTVASFYDPCGFASPLLLPAKLLLQELWKRKVKWDAEIPEDLKESWEYSLQQIAMAKEIEIPRYIGVSETEGMHYDLHCFSDASKSAYAAVVYLCLVNGDQTRVEFILSKARVTPLNDKDELKIPRLELIGFLIGSRILKYVESSLGLAIRKRYLWTDSLIVLSWMKSSKLLHPFVSRRVSEIKQNTNSEWKYVNSEQNPADLATRSELWRTKENLWFNGPTFLKQGERYWPNLPNIEKEVPEAPFVSAEALVQEAEALCAAAERLDITDPEYGAQTSELMETDEANMIKEPVESMVTKIKNLQNECFPLERSGKKTDLSRNLGLFLDDDGLLRCTGRMSHADWSFDKKHPILIPKESTFTREQILETHQRNHHVGVPHTLSIIRQQYWIPQGRSQVQKVLKTCAQCTKQGGGPYQLPPTPALPAERVNYSTPFTYTGVDYFGPIYVNRTQEKRWVCLFTCLAVRAIHMELVQDLSADEFVLALRRFTAARGVPTLIISDNALHFKLTAQVLASSLVQGDKIHWRFIPELAPWHGSFYERLIGVVKHSLRRTLEKHLLTETQILTILKEVEAVVNTRPLTYVGQDLDHVLTPADFLSLGRCLSLPTFNNDSYEGTVTSKNLVDGWKRGQRLMADFKNMFNDQYLPSLRERYQHSPRESRVKSSREPKLGDIVQIKGDTKNRVNWRVGRIVNLIKGSDGECRVALIKVGSKEFRRSINHLYPLEIDERTMLDADKRVEHVEYPSKVQPKEIGSTHVTEHIINDPETVAVEDLQTSPATPDPVVEKCNSPEVQPPPEQEFLDINDTIENTDSIAEEARNATSDRDETNAVRVPRKAALIARQKIAELTSQLVSMLALSH